MRTVTIHIENYKLSERFGLLPLGVRKAATLFTENTILALREVLGSISESGLATSQNVVFFFKFNI